MEEDVLVIASCPKVALAIELRPGLLSGKSVSQLPFLGFLELEFIRSKSFS